MNAKSVCRLFESVVLFGFLGLPFPEEKKGKNEKQTQNVGIKTTRYL